MRRAVRFLVLFSVALSFSAEMSAENDEVKECRIKVDGTGDFALYSITSRMLGTAYIDNNDFPDLFMLGDKRYGNICHRYRFTQHDAEGTPVFEKMEEVRLPEESFGNGIIVQNKKKTYLIWTVKDKVTYAEYDPKKSSFSEKGSAPLPEMEYSPRKFAVEFLPKGGVRMTYAGSVKASRRAPGHYRAADYFPYDGAGRWRGQIGADGIFSFEYPKFFAGTPTQPKQISLNKEEILGGTQSIVPISYGKDKEGFIAGNHFGGVYFIERKADGTLKQKLHVMDADANALRNPIIWAGPVLYPNEKGELVDIITTGEGGAFFFKHRGPFTPTGQPIYKEPVSLKEKNPYLYVGSLSTPNIVDWDGDGLLDVVVGNSAGFITFFKNTGTNTEPSFGSAQYLKANGDVIHIQPGYGQDVQGPGESRWGYVGANVFDWNNDGRYDILTNDSRGRHTVFMGNDSESKLAAGKSIFVNDLELHGTWRCRPGVGTLDGKYVYITLDDDDDAHLYFREDNQHLIDGGKLLLTDGSVIKANWLEAGGKGRLRFEITDWDGDGVKDLVLATNMHHAIPEPEKGIPWWNPKEIKGSTLLFLRNAGTEAEPKYEYPKQMKYKGVPVRFGHHACGASVGMLGEITGGMPNIVVADEKGSLFLLPRKHLSW